MISSIIFIAIAFTVYGAIEFYGWQALKTAIPFTNLTTAKWIYWGTSIALLALLWLTGLYCISTCLKP